MTIVKNIINMQLELTNFCNLKCAYCCSFFRNSNYLHDIADKYKQVDTNAALSLAEEAAAFGCRYVSFIGYGEPTVHPEWLRITRKFQDVGMQTSIITNLAKHYTDQEIDALARMHILWISIDTAEAATFASLRCGHSLERFVATLRRIIQHTKAVGTMPKIIANAVMCELTVFSIDKLYDLLSDCGVDILTLFPLGRVSDSEPLKTSEGTRIRSLEELDSKEASEALDTIEGLIERSHTQALEVQIQASVTQRLKSSLHQKAPSICGDSSDFRCCERIFDTVYVDCSGHILLCSAESIRTGKTIGKIQADSLENIYNYSSFQSFRKAALKGMLPIGCKDCCQYQTHASIDEFKGAVAPRMQKSIQMKGILNGTCSIDHHL